MARPARPGDTGIVIIDDFAGGLNVGKQVHVDRQCCLPDSWRTTALEPFHLHGIWVKGKCKAGDSLCMRKKCVIVKEDPEPAVVRFDTLDDLLRYIEKEWL